MVPTAVAAIVLAVALVVPSRTAEAQQQTPHPADHQSRTAESDAAWSWATDANVFYGYNYQQRKFADFSAWESQNWFMGSGERPIGRGRLTVQGMLSLEPWTIGRFVYAGGERAGVYDELGNRFPVGGSPQLYQTGESYRGTPFVNYQHPHDLIMALGAKYRLEGPRLTYIFSADLVGSPALGPPAFMHRDSARSNPQVPLNHHSLDSTHITAGVLTAGIGVGPAHVRGVGVPGCGTGRGSVEHRAAAP